MGALEAWHRGSTCPGPGPAISALTSLVQQAAWQTGVEGCDLFISRNNNWNHNCRITMLSRASPVCSLLRPTAPGLPKHVRGCVGRRITGTTHHANGNVLERSVCQSNIYKFSRILEALGEFSGQKNPLQPFIQGRWLLSEIPPRLLFWGIQTSVIWYDGTRRHFIPH